MKLPDKRKTKKQKSKKKPISKPKKEKVLVVAQEFKFARLLSGNEKKTRDRVLKTLKKWLLNCFEKGYEFKEDDFIRVWKGLFYAVWMSDKPLVQEDLCDNIAGILDLFSADRVEHAIMMTKAGFKVLATEWYGIDQHRMDKFLMLVRRYLRGAFRCLQRSEWSVECCERFSDMLSDSDGVLALKPPLYARNALSMMLHITDCYLEELCKVSKGKIPEESITALLYPFCNQVCLGDGTLCISSRRLLTEIVRQSEAGLEYQQATRAWQKMGCPTGGPDALELVVEDDDEEAPEPDGDDDQDDQDDSNEPLDPRAGRVSVSLAPLPVPATLIARQLKQLMANSSSKAYKRARICLERFEALSRDEYPLKVRSEEAEGRESNPHPAAPHQAATRLRALEKKLVAASDELALRGLSRKHRKRLLARSRAGVNLVDELGAADVSADSTNGDWQVETTNSEETANGDSNKENKVQKKRKNRKRKNAETKDDENSKKPKIDDETNQTKKTKKNNKVIKVEKKSKLSDNKGKNSEVKVSTGKSDVTKSKDDSKKVSETKTNVADSKKVSETKTDVLSVNNKSNKKKANEAKVTENKVTEKKIIKHSVTPIKTKNSKKPEKINKEDSPKSKVKLLVNKVKNFQKPVNGVKKEASPKKKVNLETPKKVKFVLKNNCMQGPVDYYQSVRQSPNIPFDSSKRPTKTNLKPSTPSPINPFFKRKLKNLK